MNKKSLKRKIFGIIAGIMFLSCIGSYFSQMAYAKVTESEQLQFDKLSKAIGVTSKDIIDCLKFSCSKNSCELVIIDGSEEHKSCFMDLFAQENNKEKNDEKAEYMKYYLNGNLKSRESVETWFSGSVKRIDATLPSGITLMIKVNDDVVGRIGLGPLVNGNPEIGYAIKKDFSSQGITKSAVNATLKFLKLLINSGKYKFEKLRATAKEDNIASNKLLSGLDFKKSEDKINDGYGDELEYFYYFNKVEK